MKKAKKLEPQMAQRAQMKPTKKPKPKAKEKKIRTARPSARTTRGGRKRKPVRSSARVVRARSRKGEARKKKDSVDLVKEALIRVGIIEGAEPRPKIAPVPTLLPEQKKRFLAELVTGEHHKVALARSGLSWGDVRRWIAPKDKLYDVDFHEEYRLALGCNDEIRQWNREHAADERGINGWLEPVYQQGKLAGYVRRFDSDLLKTQMKAGGGQRYADRQEHGGPGGVPLVPQVGAPPVPKDFAEWQQWAKAEEERKAAEEAKPGPTS